MCTRSRGSGDAGLSSSSSGTAERAACPEILREFDGVPERERAKAVVETERVLGAEASEELGLEVGQVVDARQRDRDELDTQLGPLGSRRHHPVQPRELARGEREEQQPRLQLEPSGERAEKGFALVLRARASLSESGCSLAVCHAHRSP